MTNSFSRTFQNCVGCEAHFTQKINGHVYDIDVTTGINSACGYTPFYLDGVYQSDGYADILGGQLQISWREDGEGVTDDLNIFFYSDNDPEGFVVVEELL